MESRKSKIVVAIDDKGKLTEFEIYGSFVGLMAIIDLLIDRIADKTNYKPSDLLEMLEIAFKE